MSDDRLRQAERAAASGAPEDRARLITERLRRGELDLDLVRLAAHTGDPAARLVAGHPGCGVCEESGSLPGEPLGRPGERVACHLFPSFESWCEPLNRVAEVRRRAGVAAIVQALTTQGNDGAALSEALVRWRDCPCDAHEREARARALAQGGVAGRVARLAVHGTAVLGDVALSLSSQVAVREAVQADVVPWLLKLPGRDVAPNAALARVTSASELELESWLAWVGDRLLALDRSGLDVELIRRVVAAATADGGGEAERLEGDARHLAYEVRVFGRAIHLRTEGGGVVAVAPADADGDEVAVEISATSTWPDRPVGRTLAQWARATTPDRRRLSVENARAWSGIGRRG